MRTLCRVLSVAASGYYAWRRQEGRVREYDNIRLLTKIKVIHGRSEETHSQPEDLPQAARGRTEMRKEPSGQNHA